MPPKIYVPKGFPETEALKKLIAKASTIPARGKAMETIKANFKAIVYDICSGLSAEDIAVKYNVGERSFWRFLKKLGTSMAQIQQLCREEKEFKKKTRIEKLQQKMIRKKILPTTLEDFEKLPLIQELIRQERIKGVTDQQIKRIIKAIYELCLFKGKPPSDITIDDILEFIDYKMMEWQNKGKDLRSQAVRSFFSSTYISPLRVFCQFRGLPIPPALSTTEYHSPYRKVRITVDQRYKLLKYIHDHHPEHYDLLRAVMIYLYETGSRASALRTVEFLETMEYGVRVVYAITEEKGKKARIRWEKPINPKWYPYIRGRLPISYSEEQIVRKLLKEAYRKVLPEGLTKRYALEHVFHVWRHTAANDLLEASNYNLMLVAQKLGWKNVQMIVNVYGTMDKAMLLKLSGYDIEYKAARFEFLYGKWYDDAVALGLL